jgi:hypothetical protein
VEDGDAVGFRLSAFLDVGHGPSAEPVFVGFVSEQDV